MSSRIALAVFLGLVLATGAFAGLFRPGAWYAALEKPPFTPPDWLFGPVWTVLYVCIGVAGWLVWRERAVSRVPLGLWGAQLAFNALWSVVFFGWHAMGAALVEILLLLDMVIATVVVFFRIRPLAGWLLVPYAAWVSLATYLTAGLWHLNG